MATDLANLEFLDADNNPIFVSSRTLEPGLDPETQEYIGEYKGWPLINTNTKVQIDGKDLIVLHATMPDPNYPGRYYRMAYEFKYTGPNEGDWNNIDAVADAKALIDAFVYPDETVKN